MNNEIAIETLLMKSQTIALLQARHAQYSSCLNEHWYDDQFRFVPEAIRHDSLLRAFPVKAAQKRLIRAIKQSLMNR